MKFKDWNGKEHELPAGRSASWRPSSYALIRKGDSVLFIKAGQHGMWELPGGGVELGESPAQSLVREVFEETGYNIKVTNETPLFLRNAFFYAPDIDQYFQSLLMVFKAELADDSQEKKHIDFKNEISEIKWIKLDEIRNYKITPIIFPFIEKELISSRNKDRLSGR